MANSTGAFGLKPVMHDDGSAWNGGTVPCYIDSDYATALFVGDPIQLDSTQANKHALANLGEGLMPTIMQVSAADGTGDANDVVYGVIVSFEPLYSDLSKIYNPASTARIANVCRDPSVVYEIRGDGGGTPAASWVSRNASFTYGSGSTVTGLSGVSLDEGTAAGPTVDQNLPLFIVGASSKPDETPLAVNTLWLAKLNTLNNFTGFVLGVSAS